MSIKKKKPLDEILDLDEEIAKILEGLGSGIEEKKIELISDMSDRFDEDISVHRVELRRCKTSIVQNKDGSEKRSVEDNYVIGMLPESDLPEDGEIFQLHYHDENGILKFGHANSVEPVFNVVKDGDMYYFSTESSKEAISWRLSIIDSGS